MLRAALARPAVFEGGELPVSVSVGAAHTADLPDASWSALLRAADTAMYRAKTALQDGRSQAPSLGTAADAAAQRVNGRRAGRPGTHLIPAPRRAHQEATR